MPANLNRLYIRKVILADGTEFDGSGAVANGDRVFHVWLDQGPTLAEVFTAFNDPEKTVTIQVYIKSRIDPTESRETYTGYTRITDLSITANQISIQLEKEL